MPTYYLTPPQHAPTKFAWSGLLLQGRLSITDHCGWCKAGFGPETITILRVNAGRYRFRVSEYDGLAENSAQLTASQAHVSVYTDGGVAEFVVGQDGFIKVRACHLISAPACILVSTCASLSWQ